MKIKVEDAALEKDRTLMALDRLGRTLLMCFFWFLGLLAFADAEARQQVAVVFSITLLGVAAGGTIMYRRGREDERSYSLRAAAKAKSGGRKLMKLEENPLVQTVSFTVKNGTKYTVGAWLQGKANTVMEVDVEVGGICRRHYLMVPLVNPEDEADSFRAAEEFADRLAAEDELAQAVVVLGGMNQQVP